MSDLLQSMVSFIEKNGLCTPHDRILLALSGGIDSMVMGNLMVRLGYQLAVAHCNFSLRGDESDGDENFVRIWADHNGLPFFTIRFDTDAYAEKHGISIQMAARDLRYNWFHDILKEKNYDRLALAHNKNDLAETFLINLTRGTGIRGLTGIKARNDNIIRPLLFATRQEIRSYAEQYHITWREDSSNMTTKYTRNKIRHNIIPLFEEINPGFIQSLADTSRRLAGVEEIFSRFIENARDTFLVRMGNKQMIPIIKLKETTAREAILYELLKPMEFTPGTIHEILESLDGTPGKQFFSPSHRLIKDREYLIIMPRRQEKTDKRFYIEERQTEITTPLLLHLKSFRRPPGFTISPSRHTAMLDKDRITWPLILRHWQPGDYFIPLGMKGMKKLSDFFIDRKLSIDEKENIWILTEGEQIVWIIGMRIDDRYKIREETKNILVIEWIP